MSQRPESTWIPNHEEHWWLWCLGRAKYWSTKTWPSPLTSCVTLCMLRMLCKPQFSYLWIRDTSTSLHRMNWDKVHEPLLQGLAHRKHSIHFNRNYFLIHWEKGNRLEWRLSSRSFCFALSLLCSVTTCIDSISRCFLGDFSCMFPLGPLYPETATWKVRQFNAIALRRDNSIVDIPALHVKILWQP